MGVNASGLCLWRAWRSGRINFARASGLRLPPGRLGAVSIVQVDGDKIISDHVYYDRKLIDAQVAGS
jgi:hypothetical protein